MGEGAERERDNCKRVVLLILEIVLNLKSFSLASKRKSVKVIESFVKDLSSFSFICLGKRSFALNFVLAFTRSFSGDNVYL